MVYPTRERAIPKNTGRKRGLWSIPSLNAQVGYPKNDSTKQTIAATNLKFSQNVDNSPYFQIMK